MKNIQNLKIGRIEFYKDKCGGTVEILQNNKIIQNIEFVVWDSGKIELYDEFGFYCGEFYREVIKSIELNLKSKYIRLA